MGGIFKPLFSPSFALFQVFLKSLHYPLLHSSIFFRSSLGLFSHLSEGFVSMGLQRRTMIFQPHFFVVVTLTPKKKKKNKL